MKPLTGVFAVTLLSAVAAACTPQAEQAQDFNPVRDHYRQHGLMVLAQTEPQGRAVCEFDQELVAAVLKAGDRAWFTERGGRGLMLTFYMCNAAGAPGFGDNPFNDAIANPSAGQTAEQAKDAIRAELAVQEAQLCANVAGDPRPDEFLARFCATLTPSG